MKKLVSMLTRSLTVTLLAFLSTTNYAQTTLNLSGSGTEDSPYQIGTVADWNNLAEYVAEGNKCEGLYFEMTNDISTVTMPIGKQTGSQNASRQRFAGIFDGNNHTLTVDINSEDGSAQYDNTKKCCAPFAFTQNVTIKNLHVTGSVETTSQFASGLVGQSGPDGDAAHGTCNIENCHVSVNFVGNTEGKNVYGNHGTFIAIAEGNATITNCWFDGELTGKNYYYSGGFIGLNKKTAKLTNCLFNPGLIDITNNNIGGSSEFSHDNGGTHILTDCYYTKSFSEPENAQGLRVFTSYHQGSDVTEITASDNNNYYIIKHNILWTNIIDAINGTDTSLTLLNDVIAGTEDVAIVVPTGKTFDLQLNGHTLDRGLDVVSAANDGCLFKVYGDLTIAGGTLRGGNNTGNGGAIYNEGTVVMSDITFTSNFANMGGAIYVNGGEVTVNGGTISGNTANTDAGTSGSGIFLNNGTLTLNGGTIKDNKSNKNKNSFGVGVYVNGGKFNIQGNLTIKDNKCSKSKTQQNVYLKSGEKLTVIGPINGASIRISIENNSGVITDGLQGKGSANNFISDIAGYVVKFIEDEAKIVQQITRPIEGYGTSTTDKWVFIASPVSDNVNPKDVNGLMTNNYDLYKFDQSADPLEWVNYKAHQTEGFVLENGKGYLYANSGNNVILKFWGDMYEEDTKTIDLEYDEDARLKGYNLIGNPLTVDAYIDRPYYKMNAYGTNIEAEETSSENSIAVCTGVIVVADGANETVTFSTTAPESGSKGSIKMTLAKTGKRGNSEMQDNAIVSFNKGTHLSKYIFNEDFAKLYIPQDGKDYAIVSSDRKGEMPVNFEAKEMGSYTINIEGEDMTGVYLVDKFEGAVIDLSVNTSYTFIGLSSDRSDRFKLVFDAKADDFADENFAYQSGNEIVVNGEGELQIFDVTGRKVMSTMVNGIETLEAMPQGVYIFRLIGSEVRTQKIVIK